MPNPYDDLIDYLAEQNPRAAGDLPTIRGADLATFARKYPDLIFDEIEVSAIADMFDASEADPIFAAVQFAARLRNKLQSTVREQLWRDVTREIEDRVTL